eukprot:gb/GECH01012001.1/.p1 GENE.gb/GECH01012001.1/~~gb/GECH01012001.1/.p1  ORF type:complete len:500 (+),score=144.91 gb/GECH01012001.1/:1-1500(+)
MAQVTFFDREKQGSKSLLDKNSETKQVVIVGRKETLLSSSVTSQLDPIIDVDLYKSLVEELSFSADLGDSTSTWTNKSGTNLELAIIAVPNVYSRHNISIRPDVIYSKLLDVTKKKVNTTVLLALDSVEEAAPAGFAVARVFPLFSTKTSKQSDASSQKVVIDLTTQKNETIPSEKISKLTNASDSIRLAAKLVDMPTSELHTSRFVEIARETVKDIPGVKVEVIEGKDLRDRGFGGFWGVGKAAEHPPALVNLSYTPNPSEKPVVLAGKGIVYDTGGLSMKTKDTMPGMKRDMGGAAAVFAGFVAAVKNGIKKNIHCLLCLAENSVSGNATRPDDILYMYSGKTVEVNNTDAEGRLVLADGVAYATKHLDPELIFDMATLTGAQGVSTGVKHGSLVCNNDELESKAINAAKKSGDLVHPLIYAPEILRKEYHSAVADMKNSVKNRMNAQSSCAGLFIHDHMVQYNGGWLHVDMAQPAFSGERATGYGVALILQLFECL